jgi:hypothetical protein
MRLDLFHMQGMKYSYETNAKDDAGDSGRP